MFKRNYCDLCRKSIATHKIWVMTRKYISVQIDLCNPCNELTDNDEKEDVANFIELHDKLQFLRGMDELTIERKLEETEYQYKQEKEHAKKIEQILLDNDIEWDGSNY